MRKFLFLVVLIGVIAGGGYYLYFLNVKSKIPLQRIVPTDASVFYSSAGIVEDWKAFRNSSLGGKLQQFDAVDASLKQVAQFLDVMGKEDFPLSLSVHKTSKSDFDLVFYIQKNEISLLDELIRVLAKKDNWTSNKRKLDGIEITDYREKGMHIISYCKKGDWVVISKSSFLLEEVIKTNKEVTWAPEAGKWVLFPHNFRDFTKIYMDEFPQNDMVELGDIPIVFELSYFENGITVNGSAVMESGGQLSDKYSISRNMIPMNVAQLSIKKNNELMKTGNGEQLSIFAKDGRANQTLIDTLFVEASEFPVYHVNDGAGLALLHQDRFISGHTVEQLEEVCKALVEENVWGKSVRVNRFLDNCHGEVTEGLYVNFREYSQLLKDQLTEEYRSQYVSNLSKFNFIDYLSLEMIENDNERIYEGFLSLSDDNAKRVATAEEVERNPENMVYEHNTTIISQPYLVKNHTTGEREILFQDDSLKLCLLSMSGNLLWEHALPSTLGGHVYQVDAFKNGKLQYLFKTKNTIELIDRKGNNVEGFPRTFNQPIQSLTLFDYDKNRNYRFVVSLVNGDVHFMDAAGTSLAPWNPMKTGRKIVGEVQHFREAGKDYIVALTDDAKLHGLNRRGEYYAGFPVNLTMNNLAGVCVTAGSKAGSSKMEVVSAAGKSKMVNTNGELVSKKDIPLLSGATLEVVKGNESVFFAAKRKEETNYISLKGESLFTENTAAGFIQFYNFSGHNDIVVSGDSTFSTLYSLKGDRVATFPSSNKISCIYSSAKEELWIYKVADKKISYLLIQH